MINILILLVLGLIVGLAVGYIIREKKRGVRCVGCPDGGTCAGSCGSCSGCSCGK